MGCGGRFDPARFTTEGIYPFIWDEPKDQLRAEYQAYFHRLRDVVSRAAARGGGLLVVVVTRVAPNSTSRKRTQIG